MGVRRKLPESRLPTVLIRAAYVQNRIDTSVPVAAPFVIPGILLAICFLFSIFTIGVGDRGVIGGLKRSWALSRGNRLKLAIIVIIAGVIGANVGTIGAMVELAGSPVAADILSNTIGSVLFTFLYELMAAAFAQIADTNR